MSQLENIATYWNQRSIGYSRAIHEELENGSADFYGEKLRSYAPRKGCLKCLDVGCGPGLFSILLSQEGYQVTSLDYSPGMIEKAKRNLDEAGFIPDIVRADATKLPFENESFDYIVSRNLVWNLENPEAAYKEWLRVLKPGGRILVIDANHYLHYYDERYKKAYEEKSRKFEKIRPEDRHDPLDYVDPTLINEIAKNLPLSRKLRPEWDMEAFRAFGVTRLRVETRPGWYRRESEEDSGLVGEFIVCAQKGSGKDAERHEGIHHYSKTADNYNAIIENELNSFRADAWTKKIMEQKPEIGLRDALDLGCGPGFFSILLSRQGVRTIGMDASLPMLNFAGENAKRECTAPVFLQGDVLHTPFMDHSFDLLICRNLTHMIEDHRKAYAEWFRILRPGGRLLIFDANWHLTTTDPALRRAFFEREEKTFEKYGSNYNAGNRRSSDEGEQTGTHRLGTLVRPDWDETILRQVGFSCVTTEENISDYLWDEKEKLLYGLTPMFMICAEK